MATATARDRVRALLLQPVAAAGFDLEDVELTPAGSRRVLRVVVDRDGGLDLDAVAAVSRVVDAALESEDVLGGTPYVLEVTSPGVDRPLMEPRHWRRAVTRMVQATLVTGETVRGRIISADERGVELDVVGKRTSYSFSDLAKGQVQVEFGPVKEVEPS